MAQAEFKGEDFEFPDEKEAKGKPEAKPNKAMRMKFMDV